MLQRKNSKAINATSHLGPEVLYQDVSITDCANIFAFRCISLTLVTLLIAFPATIPNLGVRKLVHNTGVGFLRGPLITVVTLKVPVDEVAGLEVIFMSISCEWPSSLCMSAEPTPPMHGAGLS